VSRSTIERNLPRGSYSYREKEDDQEIFSLAGLETLGFDDIDPAQQSPSWVPNQRVKGNTYPDILNRYSKRIKSHKYTYSSRFKIDPSNRILHIQSREIGPPIQYVSERLKIPRDLIVFETHNLLNSLILYEHVFHHYSNWIIEAKACIDTQVWPTSLSHLSRWSNGEHRRSILARHNLGCLQ
jgi:hypothetical protein